MIEKMKIIDIIKENKQKLIDYLFEEESFDGEIETEKPSLPKITQYRGISKRLMEYISNLPDRTIGIDMPTMKDAISCENKILSFALMWIVINERVNDNYEKYANIFMANVSDFEYYIKEKYSIVLKDNSLDIDTYFYDRIDLYIRELRSYTKYSSNVYPKITTALYCTPLKLNLKDHLGEYNIKAYNEIVTLRKDIEKSIIDLLQNDKI